jgi:hypothetical protein
VPDGAFSLPPTFLAFEYSYSDDEHNPSRAKCKTDLPRVRRGLARHARDADVHAQRDIKVREHTERRGVARDEVLLEL